MTRQWLTYLTALVFALAASAGASSGPHLASAARFLPSDTTIAYFSDWEAIRADMLEVWPGEPAVGDTDFIRALAGRHAPATATATAASGNPWLVHEQWGWSLLDLAWELETSAGLVVVGFAPDFDPSTLFGYLSQRGYQTVDYEGISVYSRAMDVSLPWLRPPFMAFQNLAYLDSERVLVAGARPGPVQAALDAYAGREPSWLGAEHPVVSALSDSASSVIAAQATACYGLEPNPEVLTYELAGLGYSHAGAETTGTVVLGYASAELADADLEARAYLATNGSDRSGRPFTDGMFSVSSASATGNSVVLRLSAVEPAGRLFALMYSGGAGFLACGE